MAETQVYYGSDTGAVLGPYSAGGIRDHLRAQQTLRASHSAKDVYRIDATSLEDAQAKLAAQRSREAAPRRTRATRS